MDVVFFLKAMPSKAMQALPWARETRLIGIDPPAALMCGGEDPRCSSAYTRLWSSLRDADGRAMPALLRRYAGTEDVDHVGFVGFSAAHGLLNPLAEHPDDRGRIDAYLLLDASFGGGKAGYRAFVEDAARGERLLVSATSNTGGDDSWVKVWQAAEAELGDESERVEAEPPLPDPSGGVHRLGKLAFWYRFVDPRGGTELPHWEMGRIDDALVEAYLVPYFAGELRGGGPAWPIALAVAAAGAGAAYVGWRLGVRSRR